jgi:adenylate cyclase
MLEPEETSWVTSKEIMDRTDISRATLNNYIKMGILPRPEIKKTQAGTRGARRMGYFPESVLARIETVKRLKRRGKPMDEIARILHAVPHGSASATDQSGRPNVAGIEGGGAHASSGPGEDDGLKLTIENIKSPAYLVNYNFEVEWINGEAEDVIFNASVRSISHLEARNVFKMFFNWEFSQRVQNWQEVITFHLKVAKSSLPRSRISSLYEGISASEVEFLEKGYDYAIPFPDKNINTTPLRMLVAGSGGEYFEVHTLFFREGVFFLYVPSDRDSQEVTSLLSIRERLINELIKRQLPSLVSLCVLVADMQDSVKISSELLPAEYFSMVNDLWKTLSDIFEKYGGICGKHAGDGLLHYFIKKPGSNYIMNTINCALELKEKTKIFSNELRIRKGWLNDIFLNVGINEGQEYFGTIRSTSNIEFTALGDSINYAGRLSDFARYGSIWTTKNVIIKLTPEELETIRFGVYRREREREVFVENSFMRVVDLLDQSEHTRRKFVDIATLPITEVVEKTRLDPPPYRQPSY